jgi:hypothetical protein
MDSGSSPQPCDEDYRGHEPFSEPETRAIQSMVENLPNLKVAINLHAWGNLFIHPFNYDAVPGNMDLQQNHPGAFAFYQEVWQNRGVP